MVHSHHLRGWWYHLLVMDLAGGSYPGAGSWGMSFAYTVAYYSIALIWIWLQVATRHRDCHRCTFLDLDASPASSQATLNASGWVLSAPAHCSKSGQYYSPGLFDLCLFHIGRSTRIWLAAVKR